MNKKIWLSFAIVSLLALTMVSAVTIEKLGKTRADSLYYNARCELIRPATEFRSEKRYGYIGVYGRLSNGEQICFLPSMRSNKNSKPSKTVCEMQTTCSSPVCTTENTSCDVYNYENVCENREVCEFVTNNVCEFVTECKTECHKEKVWKRTCEWKHGREYCNNGWVWEDKCENKCKNKEVCHEETEQVCHNEESCHEEQTTCSVYNIETTCTEPVCTTKKVCTKR
jgi:hypothetical protein